MNPEVRARLEEACAWELFRQGHGDPTQRAAFEELEWRRCAADPVYFLENYAWILLKDSGIIRMKLWPKQRLLVQILNAGKSFTAVKARQLGVTTVLVNFRGWKTIFREAARGNLVSDTEGKGKEAMSRLAVTLDRLPQWMRKRAQSQGVSQAVSRKNKKENSLGITFGFSEFNILPSTPNNVAGVSGDVDLDEFGRHSEQKRIIDNAIPAWEGGGQMTIVGNGNGEDHFYATCQAVKRGDFPGMEYFFFSWMDDPSRVTGENAPYIIAEGVNGATVPPSERVYYTGEDANYNDGKWTLSDKRFVYYPWYYTTQRMYLRENPEQDVFSFRAQYPTNEEEAFFLHGNSRFNMATLNHISRQLRDEDSAKHAAGIPWGYTGFMVAVDRTKDGEAPPPHTYRFDRHPTGRIRMYEPPQEGAEYVVAVDAAGGAQAGDYCVAMVGKLRRDIKGIEQVCVYQAKVETLQLAETALRLGYFYNEALMVIETGASGHGTAVANIVKEDYTNLYRQIRTSRAIDREQEEIGFSTNRTSKDALIDTIANWIGMWDGEDWVEEPLYIFHDARTLEEMNRFQINPETKKSGAPKGSNDDLVMASGFLIEGAKYSLAGNDKPRSLHIAPWEW
jgi:hypothetical protein